MGHHLGAVGFVEVYGPGRADPMAVEEYHAVAHALLLGPGRHDAGRARGTDAVECLHAGAGCAMTSKTSAPKAAPVCGQSTDQCLCPSGTQVWLNAFECGGRDHTPLRGLQLQAMDAGCDPPAMALDILPGRDREGRAYHRDERAVSTDLDAEHAEADLFAVQGDTLDAAGELFQGYVQGC